MAGEATMRPGSSAATLGALLLLGILRPAACVDDTAASSRSLRSSSSKYRVIAGIETGK